MMPATPTPELEAAARRRTVWFLSGILTVYTVALLVWAGTDPSGFFSDLGVGAQIPVTGWILAGIAVVVYTTYTLWAVPEIRPVAAEVSWFRALALPLAVGSGLIEEIFFRDFLMSRFAAAGIGTLLQIIASASIFAVVHTVWLVFGNSWRTTLPILLSTFGLGILMSLVYLASDRIVLTAVLAHAAINLIIEPGLLLSSARRRLKAGKR